MFKKITLTVLLASLVISTTTLSASGSGMDLALVATYSKLLWYLIPAGLVFTAWQIWNDGRENKAFKVSKRKTDF